jgi:hypothetical protein
MVLTQRLNTIVMILMVTFKIMYLIIPYRLELSIVFPHSYSSWYEFIV